MQYQEILESLPQNTIYRDLFPNSYGHLHSNAAHFQVNNPKTDTKNIEKADNYMQYSRYPIKYNRNLEVLLSKDTRIHHLEAPIGNIFE